MGCRFLSVPCGASSERFRITQCRRIVWWQRLRGAEKVMAMSLTSDFNFASLGQPISLPAISPIFHTARSLGFTRPQGQGPFFFFLATVGKLYSTVVTVFMSKLGYDLSNNFSARLEARRIMGCRQRHDMARSSHRTTRTQPPAAHQLPLPPPAQVPNKTSPVGSTPNHWQLQCGNSEFSAKAGVAKACVPNPI